MAFASPSRNQIFLVSVASKTKLRQKFGFDHREERAGDSVFSFSLSENRLGGKSTCRFCEIRHQKSIRQQCRSPEKKPQKHRALRSHSRFKWLRNQWTSFRVIPSSCVRQNRSVRNRLPTRPPTLYISELSPLFSFSVLEDSRVEPESSDQ